MSDDTILKKITKAIESGESELVFYCDDESSLTDKEQAKAIKQIANDLGLRSKIYKEEVSYYYCSRYVWQCTVFL